MTDSATRSDSTDIVSVGQARLTAFMAKDRIPMSYHNYLRRLGQLPQLGASVIDIAKQSAIVGRGGGGFELAVKLQVAVQATRSRKKLIGRLHPVVVVNGAESEPASVKDRSLLALAPHLVLDGAVLAAQAISAGRIIVYIHDDDKVAGIMQRAIGERFTSSQLVPELIQAPPAYLSGESSTVANYISQAKLLPTFSMKPQAYSGVNKSPTVISNVETLADLALACRYGTDWYRQVGCVEEPGTVLTTLSGPWKRSAVVEVPTGTLLVDAFRAAGFPTSNISHVLTGGYAGSWVPWSRASSIGISHKNFAKHGARLGPGIMVAIPHTACPLRKIAPVIAYLADQGARQCGPCLYGLPALAEAFSHLASGNCTSSTVARLRELCSTIAGRGACGHPNGVVGVVESTLEQLSAEVHQHTSQVGCSRPYQKLLSIPSKPR